MSGHPNLAAYEGIERLSNYRHASLIAYRCARLDRCQPVVELIQARSSHDAPVSIVEIGSGSSALLYGLARAGVLREALGIELSQSRFEFAERWKQDDDFASVRNVNANFVDVSPGDGVWDWWIVIDNTFTYLHPEDHRYPGRLLGMAYAALKPGGRLLLDFINYAKRTPGVEYKQWAAFPADDPYSYGLYSNRIEAGINDSESIFIKRDGSESRKVEKMKVYSLAEITGLLQRSGFEIEWVAASFLDEPFIENASERLVIIAAKSPRLP